MANEVIAAVQAAVVTAKTDEAKAVADVKAAVHEATGFWASLVAHPVTSGIVFVVGAIAGGVLVHLVA